VKLQMLAARIADPHNEKEAASSACI